MCSVRAFDRLGYRKIAPHRNLWRSTVNGWQVEFASQDACDEPGRVDVPRRRKGPPAGGVHRSNALAAGLHAGDFVVNHGDSEVRCRLVQLVIKPQPIDMNRAQLNMERRAAKPGQRRIVLRLSMNHL
jgi:hypothetical protein